MLPSLELSQRDPFAHPDAERVKNELEACFRRIAIKVENYNIHYSGKIKDVINYKSIQPHPVYISWMGIGTEEQRLRKQLIVPMVASVTLEKDILRSGRIRNLDIVQKGIDDIFGFFSRYGNEFYIDENKLPVLEVNILFAPIVQLLEKLEKYCWFSIKYVDVDKIRAKRMASGKPDHIRESYLKIIIVLKNEYRKLSWDYDFLLTLTIRSPNEDSNARLKAQRKLEDQN